MSKAVRIEPDLQFIKDLQAVGGDSLKKCYQCATCSVACPLSPADAPYPRKEMVWAQWGLKDKLVNDIDIWLCHNCGTCSDLCPRGAKPGDLLAALRNMAYRSLVSPTILGTWMSSSKYLPILVAIPAALWLFVWYLTTGLTIPEGDIVFGKIFPGDYTIDPIMSLTFFFMVASFVLGVSRLIKSFGAAGGTYYVGEHKKPSVLNCIKDVLFNEVGQHANFKECGGEVQKPEDEERFKGHLALFYSFVILAVVTGLIAFGHWGGKVIHFLEPMGHTPLPLYAPHKFAALVGMCLGIYGLVKLTSRRMNLDQSKTKSSYYDWYLLGVVWAVFATGAGALLFRLAGVATLAYVTYYVHLVAVWMLFAYLPWSKLGHLVYRTVALIYARYIGRVPLS
ncbi:quinone-interacting membrane-bound oxidoreductase complex subunit QmoC [Desulfocurvus sp.]|jgi:quinone-modifying oxidoreductase subunit QmoC|uniref:quinone-interacting membrane-bound oxidoreductase complex subunit QmoC n=1 Tax=Desulfocurvus sp. TaxID=2871698 RepID=UPI0025C6F708|nr:quinone-interacting membrane-bound oxidoreductase complex subunit QmoC [Desulfocurvus sp.]MCK9240402.1 quinone-interacting membrane-bound oxidoreductase complex subunit QmoC [Desulfocurvus sp.]